MPITVVNLAATNDAATLGSQEAQGDMAGFQIKGTWSGTSTFEATVPGAGGSWGSVMAPTVSHTWLATPRRAHRRVRA